MQFFKPGTININFVGKRRPFVFLSTVLVLASIGVFVGKQLSGTLNWGIDFAGGTMIELEFAKEVDIAQVRKVVTELGYKKNVIQQSAFVGKDKQTEYLIRVERIAILSAENAAKLGINLQNEYGEKLEQFSFDADSGDQFGLRFTQAIAEEEIAAFLASQAQALKLKELADVTIRARIKEGQARYSILMTGVASQIEKAMQTRFPDSKPVMRKVEFVGPQVGSKLRTDGILAIIYAIAGILVYVAFRFNIQFAPGAVLALAHDSILTIGLFAFLGLEFNLTFIAAILTVIGYSVNDTIVIYDRIRENMTRIRNQAIDKVINSSLNEVLNRTILTSVTTIMALSGLLFIGFGEIKEFAIAMTFGVLVGTYSSIYVAGSTTIWLEGLTKKLKKA